MSGPHGPSQQGGRPAQGHPASAAGAGQRTNPGLPVPGRRPGRPGQGRTAQGGAEQQGRATQPGQTQPGHTQPGQAQPGQAQPGQTQAGQTQPGQAQPGQAQPGQTQPGQTQPGQAQPGQTHPGQAQQTQTQPGLSHPGQPHPGRTQQTGQHPPRPDQQSRPRQGESGAQQSAPDRRTGAANPGQQPRTGDARGRPRATGAESTHPNLPPIVVGPPGRGSAPPPAPRTRSKVPWVFGGAVLVTVAGSLAVVGFVHPGVLVHDRFDPESVQQGVAQTLRDSYHLGTVESVSCPAEQQVVPGNRFDCQVTLGGGTKPVSVTVRDASGTYEVGYPR